MGNESYVDGLDASGAPDEDDSAADELDRLHDFMAGLDSVTS
jgi:hypothetical protein